ncbi:MAG TPA: prepilin-type N-terminal cleavage/methylation domain-containing protein [Gemmatimonadales bacterium]|nr:prepilin-type N-terminal cleavage/methylation domain-containing protein [Gemmatimonadales bacterium]
MRSRRGFTLIELMVALLLLTAVVGSIYKLLVATQRVSRAQSEHVNMQANMRAGAFIVPAELRAIGYDVFPPSTVVPDIEDMQATSITFRAQRSAGIICQVNAGQVVVDTTTNYSSLRAPNTSPTDSIMLFVDGDPTISTDDRWVSRAITATSTTTCPSGAAARSFTVGADFNATGDPIPQTSITIGSPMRTFEGMQYSLYQSGSEYYLGAKSVNDASATRQPVLGPLSSNNGFNLAYYDQSGTAITGNTATDHANVRTIQVTFVSVSDQNVTTSGYGTQQQAVDSVVALVQLRNMR